MVYFLQELVTPDVQKEEIEITKPHGSLYLKDQGDRMQYPTETLK